MTKDEFKCFECAKTYDKEYKGRYISCVFCEEARHEYQDQDRRERDEECLTGSVTGDV